MVGVKPCDFKIWRVQVDLRNFINFRVLKSIVRVMSLKSLYQVQIWCMFPDWKSAKFVSNLIAKQQCTTHPKSIGMVVNYRIELSLIVASFGYSPKATTMRLTITDDIEVIAEIFGWIQGLYVSLGSFSFVVMWFRKVEDRNSFSAICQNSIITPSTTRWRIVGREKYTRILAISRARVYFSRPTIHRWSWNFVSSRNAPPVTTQRM